MTVQTSMRTAVVVVAAFGAIFWPGVASASPTSTSVANPSFSPASPVLTGQEVTISTNVSPAPDGGTVSFIGSGLSGISGCTDLPVDPITGRASCTTDGENRFDGFPDVSASYSGDANFASSTSPSSSQLLVDQASTQIALSSSPNPGSTGRFIQLSATVTAVSPSVAPIPQPDGWVEFCYVPSTTPVAGCLNEQPLTGCSSQALFNAQADCSVSLAAGTYDIEAVFIESSGDYTSSTSSVLTEIVANATTTTLTPSANPAAADQPMTYTATITPTPSGGTVAFADTLGALSNCGAVSVNTDTGVAVCTTTYGVVGFPDIVTATFSGSPGFAASTSSRVTETVTPLTALTIPAQRDNVARTGSFDVRLTCAGYSPSGMLTLRATVSTTHDHKRKTATVTIGATEFNELTDGTNNVRVVLSHRGSLLLADHGYALKSVATVTYQATGTEYTTTGTLSLDGAKPKTKPKH